ncbi:hypothetical protein J7376_11535 [Paracoccus sp. R12_1]|uniref:hypothetical protein n=1 Tax=unclassified Paracoccus (in: a-proteobacteria) TaxID=2688777 RepID=UPI001ADB7B99|nr:MULTISPECIES: hypothetical protein [unclassified Paracoccus (in: a-proteobacteria)]MBO9455721.1 hypothetical protein [Paracoccus sp. R12_2]MBO9487154.1 hypothetical protein [Paracoccus sp. R12_1]
MSIAKVIPGTAVGVALETIDKDGIRWRVVDLHNVRRSFCLVLPHHWRQAPPRCLCNIACFHDLTGIHRFKPPLRCPARRRLHTLLSTRAANFRDNSRQAWVFSPRAMSMSPRTDPAAVGQAEAARQGKTQRDNRKPGEHILDGLQASHSI